MGKCGRGAKENPDILCYIGVCGNSVVPVRGSGKAPKIRALSASGVRQVDNKEPGGVSVSRCLPLGLPGVVFGEPSGIEPDLPKPLHIVM